MDITLQKERVETIYASVSSNRHENNISCQGDYLLYSRCHSPIIYDLFKKQVKYILIGHKAEVNGQCFIPDLRSSSSSNTHILSTSYDNTAIIWELDEKSNSDYKILLQLVSPDGSPFISRCAFRVGDEFISVTTTINGSIYLWLNDRLAKTIDANYYCFHIQKHIIHLDNEHYGPDVTLLFLAGSDNMIHVFQLVNSEIIDLHVELSGHNDWIKCSDVLNLNPGDHVKPEFLIASASQDSYIRVWHMKLIETKLGVDYVRTVVSQPLVSSRKELRLTATLETVLFNHEGIVHGLCWFRSVIGPALQLLSCSEDKTINIWNSTKALVTQDNGEQQISRYEMNPASSGIWKVSHALGETGETNLPFLAVCLSSDERVLYSQSLKGAIHSWRLAEDGQWYPQDSITGHFEPVTDLSWERSGSYLLSASSDKTCRLHGISSIDGKWCELARPQVHGHELNCVTSMNFCKFATGGEEKTVRVYGATQFFVNNFEALSKNLAKNLKLTTNDLPKHGRLPALGLSIRGAPCPYDIDEDTADFNSASTWYKRSQLSEKLAIMEHLDKLPSEEILLQSTLWYEASILIGHGNELQALAADSTGTYLASSSRAKKSDITNFIVWSCAHARKSATIDHHSLTITRLRFSPDDKYLLSVSRDRTWCISEQTGKVRPSHKKLFGSTQSDCIHKRIIWDCCWTCDSEYFVTVSRDKIAVVWSISKLQAKMSTPVEPPNSLEPELVKEFQSSIQAVDSPVYNYSDKQYLFAFGFEDGSLDLYNVSMKPSILSENRWQLIRTIKNLHHLPIRRLAFQPKTIDSGEPKERRNFLLASGGDDCIVKLVEINL